MHENSKLIFTKHVRPLISPEMHVLELGPDQPNSTFMHLAEHRQELWTTCDINTCVGANILMENGYEVPVLDRQYDVVFSANVLEHVPCPGPWLDEQERVCKPGGLVIFIAPVSWPYHEAPVDVARYHPLGVRELLAYTSSLTEVFISVEMLEPVGRGTPVPGRSLAWVHEPDLKEHYELNMNRGGPVETPLDLVCIARKATI